MNIFSKLALLLLLSALLLPLSSARADEADMIASVSGLWRNSAGDAYRFQRNGTYTFSAGAAKRRAGNISHSGTWRLTGNGMHFDGFRLRSTRRTVLEGRRRRVLRSARVFNLSWDNAMGQEGETDESSDALVLNGVRFRHVN